MSENTNDKPDETTPDRPADQPTGEPTEEPTAAAEPRRGLRDRLLGVRGLIAVGAATLILGGVGGYAVGAATSGGPDDHGHERSGRPFDDAGRGGFPPPGNPGGLPPTMPEDGAPVQPDGGGATNGSTT